MSSKSKPAARPVLRLIDFAKQRREEHRKETIAILSEVLAQAALGNVDGIVLCVRWTAGFEPRVGGVGGDQCVVFTGPYEANVAEAMNAAARITALCLEMQEKLE